MIETMKNIHREHIQAYDRSKLMKKADEELCLQMLIRPEFVENLNILRQGSGSTIATQAVGELASHTQIDKLNHSSNHVSELKQNTEPLPEHKDKRLFAVQDRRFMSQAKSPESQTSTVGQSAVNKQLKTP